MRCTTSRSTSSPRAQAAVSTVAAIKIKLFRNMLSVSKAFPFPPLGDGAAIVRITRIDSGDVFLVQLSVIRVFG